jgi:cytochrome P450
MERLALSMFGLAAFGAAFAEQLEPICDDLDRLLAVGTHVASPWSRRGEYLRLRRSLRLHGAYQRLLGIVRALLEERRYREGDERDDVPGLLESTGREAGLDEDERAAEALLILLAGYETTATALACAGSSSTDILRSTASCTRRRSMGAATRGS